MSNTTNNPAQTKQSRVLFFPGSFDPFTVGHADIVARALPLCDRLIIGLGCNERKTAMLSAEDRSVAIEALYCDDPRITVVKYTDLTVDAAKRCGADYILRGVRSVKDYEYELQMADVNRQLAGIDTIVLFSDPQLASISSSVVRELAHFGKDITPYLPKK